MISPDLDSGQGEILSQNLEGADPVAVSACPTDAASRAGPGLTVCDMEHTSTTEPQQRLSMPLCKCEQPTVGDRGGGLQNEQPPGISLCECNIEQAPAKEASKSSVL